MIDPETTLSMDPFLSACTGIDALVHAIEAFVSTGSGPLTDTHALEAMRLIGGNLVQMIATPQDIALREKIMLGSMQAGLAFSNAILGAVHAMSHSLGGYLDLPHGMCNAALVEHVVAFNYHSAPERFRMVAEALGLDVRGLNHEQIRLRLIDHLIAFKQSVGFRHPQVARRPGCRYSLPVAPRHGGSVHSYQSARLQHARCRGRVCRGALTTPMHRCRATTRHLPACWGWAATPHAKTITRNC